LLLCLGILFATPGYVPTTTLAEDFGATWCPGCVTAWQGLQELHNHTHNGEFLSARLYTESGDLSNPTVQDRFNYYEVIGVPEVIFNGKVSVLGSDVGIGDGVLYNKALNQFRYTASPVSISIGSFSPTAGTLTGNVQMVSPTASIANAKMVYYLLEDDVSDSDTHVVRAILYDENVALSGVGTNYAFNKSFALTPSWNTANLWAIAALQLENKAILQSASSLPLPSYNFRAAMDWNPSVEGPANTSYLSSPLWFFNLGASDNYTMRIQVDQAPDDWYFNYCDEEGNCYPGSMDRPFSLGAGEMASYHLNLWIGSPGFAYYRFVISSPNLGEYSIPFHYKVEGVANEDAVLIPSAFSLGKVYPNPVSERAELSINAQKQGSQATVDIYDLKGRKVRSQNLTNLSQGQNRIALQVADLPNGVYFYKLHGQAAPAQKFILMK